MNLNSDIAPNKSVENARLRPRNKYKPDLYTPKYAYYIWQNHAANVIKYVETLQSGVCDTIIASTDSAIQDIWDVLEDEEKTLDIVARFANLSIHVGPENQATLSNADHIYEGVKYIVQTLGFIHARMAFLQMQKEQFDVAEIYIVNFENRKGWLKVISTNKRFGGKNLHEGELEYEIFGANFNTLKSRIYAMKYQYDAALKLYLSVPMVWSMCDWKFRTWGDNEQYECPERYELTVDERNEIVAQLDEAKAAYMPAQLPKKENVEIVAYKAKVKADRESGKMASVQCMLDAGIFWTTIKCPRCVRECPPTVNLFYSACKMCRNIQVTALLGHMPVDDKYFAWVTKESSTLTEEEVRRNEEKDQILRQDKDRQKKLAELREKERQLEILEEKEAAARKLLETDQEMNAQLEQRARARHSTNQMLAEADQLLQETVRFTKDTEQRDQLSDEFLEMIKRERAEKAIGQSVTENTNLTNPKEEEETKKDDDVVK